MKRNSKEGGAALTGREEMIFTLRNLALDRTALRLMEEDVASIKEDEKRTGLPALQREALKKERIRLLCSLTATQNYVRRVERLLALLTPEEQLVLDAMLIHPRPEAAFDLAQELHCESSAVYRIRARALRKLVRLRYGAEG